jgi:hypothetical protein
MAKETLLESDIDAGARFIEALDNDGETVEAAFWFYYPDLSQWKLILFAPAFDKIDLTKAYTKISELLSSRDEIGKNISVADIKILKQKDPLMKLLRSIVRTGKGLSQIRMTSNLLNGIYVEDALIYRNA